MSRRFLGGKAVVLGTGGSGQKKGPVLRLVQDAPGIIDSFRCELQSPITARSPVQSSIRAHHSFPGGSALNVQSSLRAQHRCFQGFGAQRHDCRT
jgi:hypothetical protein